MFGKIYQILFPADSDGTVISDAEGISVSAAGKSGVAIAWDAITDIQVMRTAISTDYPSLVWILRSHDAELSFTSHTPGAEGAVKRIYNLPGFDSELYYHALEVKRAEPISICRIR